MRNFDEADSLPGTGCVIRALSAEDGHWCNLCGQIDMPEDVCSENEIPLCGTCVSAISLDGV
jgi:hypothetical protein